MNEASGARILAFLVRSERVLRGVAPEQAKQVEGLIAVVRALPPPAPRTVEPSPPAPPLRHLARKLAGKPVPEAVPEAFSPQEAPTRPDRVRPPRKRHLRIVPPPVPPLKLEPQQVRKEAPPDPIGDKMREAEGARALLLEIVRRAAYDWVLYRSSTRLDQKILAEDAYCWLFLEDENHPHWKTRREEAKLITGFISICEALDLDVNKVRQYIKALTPNRVMSSGRPPENSRASDHSPHIAVHTKVSEGLGTRESVDYDALIMQLLDFDG